MVIIFHCYEHKILTLNTHTVSVCSSDQSSTAGYTAGSSPLNLHLTSLNASIPSVSAKLLLEGSPFKARNEPDHVAQTAESTEVRNVAPTCKWSRIPLVTAVKNCTAVRSHVNNVHCRIRFFFHLHNHFQYNYLKGLLKCKGNSAKQPYQAGCQMSHLRWPLSHEDYRLWT